MPGGKCIDGPWNGQLRQYPSTTMPVQWIDVEVGSSIQFKREGRYEFLDGIWRWCGPPYRTLS